MDVNHQNGTNNNLATTENKIWLPPSFINNKASVVLASKKRDIKWGFAERTVFDWAMLISQVLGAIAIPFVVTILGLYLTQQVTQQQAQASERQHQTDLQIANDQQQYDILQTYLDNISDLLLNHNLHASKPGNEVSQLARERTITVLRRLNAKNNRIVLQFLQDSHLIGSNNAVIDLSDSYLTGDDLTYVNLSGALLNNVNLKNTDLSGTYLTDAHLNDAHLNNANLSMTHLSGADLSGADLSKANFRDADLNTALVSNEQLAQAKSLKGAIMPDGSIHPYSGVQKD